MRCVFRRHTKSVIAFQSYKSARQSTRLWWDGGGLGTDRPVSNNIKFKQTKLLSSPISENFIFVFANSQWPFYLLPSLLLLLLRKFVNVCVRMYVCEVLPNSAKVMNVFRVNYVILTMCACKISQWCKWLKCREAGCNILFENIISQKWNCKIIYI